MKKLIEILQKVQPEGDFLASNDFVTDGLLDSLEVEVLVDEMEQEYNVEFHSTDMVEKNFKNLEAIQQMLAKYGVREAI